MSRHLLKIVFLACVACFASNIGCHNELYAHSSVGTFRYNHPIYDMAIEEFSVDFEHAGEDYLHQYIGNDSDPCGTVASSNARHIVTASRTALPRTIKRYHSFLRQANSTTIKVGKTIDCRTLISHIEARGLLPMATKSCSEFITLICKFNIEP